MRGSAPLLNSDVSICLPTPTSLPDRTGPTRQASQPPLRPASSGVVGDRPLLHGGGPPPPSLLLLARCWAGTPVPRPGPTSRLVLSPLLPAATGFQSSALNSGFGATAPPGLPSFLEGPATVPQKAQARNTLFFGLWAKGEGSREGWEEGRQSSEPQGRAGRPTGLGGSAGGLLPREGLCPGPEPKALNRTSFHFLKGSLLPAVQISRLSGLSGCNHSAPGSPSVSVWVSACAHPPCEFPSTVPLSALPGV